MAKRIRVLIIDDNRLMREGLCALLNAQQDLHVVAAAGDTATGLRQVPEATPDIVLVDAGLAGGDPGHCVHQIRMSMPTARVIVMDLLPATADVVAFAKAGANGFMTKDAAAEDLVGAVRSVARGTDMIPPAFAGTLLSHIARDGVIPGLQPTPATLPLTTREREVMDLIADGMSNKAIARRLGVADGTVKSHVRNMLEKLALHSRLEIAAHSHRAALPGQGAKRSDDPPRERGHRSRDVLGRRRTLGRTMRLQATRATD